MAIFCTKTTIKYSEKKLTSRQIETNLGSRGSACLNDDRTNINVRRISCSIFSRVAMYIANTTTLEYRMAATVALVPLDVAQSSPQSSSSTGTCYEQKQRGAN